MSQTPMGRRAVSVAALLLVSFLAPVAHAEDWAWRDVSLNYLAWTQRTLDRTDAAPFGQKKDFPYLEAEGARGGDWGDLYGFFDLENPTHNTENTADRRADRRTAAKVVARFKLTKFGAYPLMAYAHIYDFVDNGFGDQDRVLGFGTDVFLGSLALRPFLGVHDEFKSGVGAKSNGGMAGYTLYYPFALYKQKFFVTQWHETEFARKDEFLDLALGGSDRQKNSVGENGALSLWWMASSDFTAGISYRYADNKLAIAGYEDGFIYTLKYQL